VTERRRDIHLTRNKKQGTRNQNPQRGTRNTEPT